MSAVMPDGVYDLVGRRIALTSAERLPRGIYVICKNGQRTIVTNK